MSTKTTKRSNNKKEKKKSFFSNIKLKLTNYFKADINYVQMRLRVEKITSEFEENIKKDIESKIIRAEIREAVKNDVETLIDIRSRSWHSTTMPYHPMKKKSFLKLFDDTDIIILIAKVNNIDSGFIISYFTGKHKEFGVIAGLGVVPELQRQGLGKILGMAGWNYFKNRNVKELRCKVYKYNKKSYQFIKALGFEEYEEDEITWKIF